MLSEIKYIVELKLIKLSAPQSLLMLGSDFRFSTDFVFQIL